MEKDKAALGVYVSLISNVNLNKKQNIYKCESYYQVSNFLTKFLIAWKNNARHVL